MAWYNTGTIALTNGSATVTGSGTNFLVGAQIGEALYAPDGKLYEIQTINSATVITLATTYLGSTASTQGYQIIPTQSLVADLASDVTDLISDFADVRDYAGNGKFNDGAVGTPGITFTQDQDNGLYRIGSNNWALAAGGQQVVNLTTTAMNFPDNSKAIFGTGSDLQIYSDGTTGQVTGNVNVTGSVTATGTASLNSGNGSGTALQVGGESGGGIKTRYVFSGVSQHNWQLGFATHLSQTFSITPSSAVGNTTFTTPALNINGSTGAATFSGSVTADGLTVQSGVADIRAGNIGPSSNASVNIGRADTSIASGNPLGYVQFLGSDNTAGSLTPHAYIGAIASSTHSAGSNPTEIVFGTTATSSETILERLKISDNGDLSLYEDTGTTPKFFWDASAESLGIGTSSPAQKLEIFNSSTAWNQYAIAQFTTSAGISGSIGYHVGTSSTADRGLFLSGSGGTAKHLVVTPTGSVGIGTSSIDGTLHVHTASAGTISASSQADDLVIENSAEGGMTIITPDNQSARIRFTSPSTTADVGGASIFYRQNINKMSLGTEVAGGVLALKSGAGSEGLLLDASGNLLVGASSQISNGIQCNEFDGTTHNGIVLKTTRAALNSTFATFINSAGASCGAVIQNGTTTVNYGASSDRRLKENISDSDDSGLVIDAIQVRKFDWIGTDEHERYGFIAQELQEVVPVAVCSMGMPDEEDPMLGVDPSKLMALAIKEIQSLRARIAALES